MNVIIDKQGKRVDHLIAQASFEWETPHSMSVWEINHFLGKYPSVFCVESTGEVIYGQVVYTSPNTITVTFLGPLMGKAYLN